MHSHSTLLYLATVALLVCGYVTMISSIHNTVSAQQSNDDDKKPLEPIAACVITSTQADAQGKYWKVDMNKLAREGDASDLAKVYHATQGFEWDFFLNFCRPAYVKCGKTEKRAFALQQNADPSMEECFLLSGADLEKDVQYGVYANGVNVTMINGDKTGSGVPRGSKVQITCNPKVKADPVLDFEGEEESAEAHWYKFTMQTADACPEEASGPGGDGINPVAWFFLFPNVGGFLMLFIAVVAVVYLVVGIIVNKKKFDKRGAELIPQWEMWREVPGLIKDGALFIGDGCMKLFKRGKYRNLDVV